MHRTHINHRATFIIFIHVWQTRLGGQKRPIQMNGKHFFPIIKLHFFNATNHLNARIGYQNIHSAMSIDQLLYAFINRLFIGDVHFNGDGLPA